MAPSECATRRWDHGCGLCTEATHIPTGIFSTDITLDPIGRLEMTIRLEGIVAM